MTLYIDASAIVAIIAREPEARSFGDRIDWETDRLTSATAVWEATRGVEGARGVAFEEARDLVRSFLTAANIRVTPIGDREADFALEAHRRFGKGVHSAGLNFGDCFAYACTKTNEAETLFKGEDFIHTDLRDAMLP